MTSLIKSERQILRAIQQHMLLQKTRDGAVYKQMGTVGVIYHLDTPDPDLNLVTPHQGVAWTRREDIDAAFEYLKSYNRDAQLQYLSGLFPEAYSRQLNLLGLELSHQIPLWLYSPIQGPFPEHETPFGQVKNQDFKQDDFSIETMDSHEGTGQWLRTYQAAAYDVDLPFMNRVELETLRNEQRQGYISLILGFHHSTPIVAIRVTLNEQVAEIEEPAIMADWAKLGYEEAILAYAIKQLQQQERRVIYVKGSPTYQSDLYLRLGFIRMTEQYTFQRG